MSSGKEKSISFRYLSVLTVEFSTFFDIQRVAKVSTGLIPPPFLITLIELNELNWGKFNELFFIMKAYCLKELQIS